MAEPILVGREKELEELRQLLNLAIEGKGKTVFISGEAGSGKTRLTREFIKASMKQGFSVMIGWCLSDAQVPYFPFLEAFNSYYSSTETQHYDSLSEPSAPKGSFEPFQTITQESGITAWLTGPTPIPQPGKPEFVSPQVWKDQLFAGVAKTLHLIAAQAPVILFIEDVHWADSASLAMLHYVARAINDSEKVLLLATFRSEELISDAEGHPHPLADTLRMMRREDLFTEIKLSTLSQAHVSKIAENMIGGTLQSDLSEKLTSESRGNPLFVVESLRMLHEHKGLVQENGGWRLAVDEFGIPSKIKDIILRRLSCLKYAQRRVLDAASVIGEEFNVDFLGPVLGQDSLEVLETLNQIAHSTSLVRVEGDNYRFDHAKSRETLYEELALPLKRGYHLRIAEKLESAKGAALPLSDLAYHYAQAGNREKAVKFALAAGQDELVKYSNTQAIRHFQYVLQNIRDGQTEEKNAALEGLGDAYAASYMYAEALKTFDKLAGPETGDLKLRLRAIRKASDAAYRKGDEREPLLEYAKKAQQLGVDDRLEMARIIDNRGKAWHWWNLPGDDPLMGLADYDAALHVFEEENSLVDTAEALVRSGIMCVADDSLREKGLNALLRSVTIFRELADVRNETYATRMTGFGFWIAGLYPETRREYAKVLKIGEKLGVFTELAYSSGGLSLLDELDGKLEEALSEALKALEYSKKTDMVALHAGLCARLAALYGKLGDLKKADEYFDRISKLPQEIFFTNSFVINAETAVGDYFAVKGQWEESNQFFEKAIVRRPESSGPVRSAYAWALERQGRFDDAKVQWDIVQPARWHKQVEERFEQANLQLGFMLPRKVSVEEEFEMRLDLVNVGRKPAFLVKIEGVTHSEFNFTTLPSFCSLQGSSILLKDKSVGPFEVETVKLNLSATTAGSYSLNPEVFYTDDLGNTKTFKVNPITLTVEPAKPDFEVLPRRVSTGTMELDKLLLGGIPESYAVVLAASSSDEREMLINNFLEAREAETTFYLTAELGNAAALAEKHPSSSHVFICNPRADAAIQNLPNVTKLKGVENLTEIDIAMTKAFRTLKTPPAGSRKACITILSDVLLQHHAMITRKWLSALLPDLKSKGFTTLAEIDPAMHPPDEAQAVLGLFDGEIGLTEKESNQRKRKVLQIVKLYNQRYLENELVLTKEKPCQRP